MKERYYLIQRKDGDKWVDVRRFEGDREVRKRYIALIAYRAVDQANEYRLILVLKAYLRHGRVDLKTELVA